MRKTKTRVTFLIFALVIFFVISACSKKAYLALTAEQIQVTPHLKQLFLDKQEYFRNQITLAVMLDRKACSGNLVESKFWKDWQKYMLNNKHNFIFITTKKDSIDVAIAAKFDSVVAPILILPGNHEFISNLWKPGQSAPLKILIDSTGNITSYWLSILNKEQSKKLLQTINTLVK